MASITTERIEQLEREVSLLLKHAENARTAMLFKVESERTAALSEGYDLIRTMGGRQPCNQCSGTGTRVYVMDSLERCKDCGGNGYTVALPACMNCGIGKRYRDSKYCSSCGPGWTKPEGGA